MAVGVILAVASIGSKLLSARKGRKASKKNRRAKQLQQRLVELRNARSRRDGVRQARQVRANVIAAGASTGASLDSSSVQGAEQSVLSQLNSNLTLADENTTISRESASLTENAADDLGRANLFEAVGNVTGQFASATGGFESLGSVFAGGTKTQSTEGN